MSALRIGLIAPPWVPVPPPAYGGTEVVIDVLARGLQRAGHHVVLFATGDSTCPVPRRWRYERALGTEAPGEAEVGHVAAAYALLDGKVDVIHDHTLAGPRHLARTKVRTPVVVTAHGPFVPDQIAAYQPVSDRVALVAISHAHAAGAVGLPISAVIPHGLELDQTPVGTGGGGYVAFLGRMSPDKGPGRAIRAARAAGVPIRLAGKMWEAAERRCFAEQVEPLLGRDAVYVGEVRGVDKCAFLGEARALLNPILWPEPFGLVMIEALACGTPVVTFAEGAAPEIVRHGIDGFLCADEATMATAIGRLEELDRRRCREGVMARFAADRMVADYVALYRSLAEPSSSTDPAAPPVATTRPA
jgi:glycosyltransferase involved in cell wall biosynthesis